MFVALRSRDGIILIIINYYYNYYYFQNEYRIPFELKPKIIRTDKLVFHITSKLSDLCLKLREHSFRVHLNERLKRFKSTSNESVSHLEKLLYSLRSFLSTTGLSVVECDYLLNRIQEILQNL